MTDRTLMDPELTDPPHIQPVGPDRLPDLRVLYGAAFPDEELRPLVTALFGAPGVLSLGAVRGAELLGHVMLTDGTVGQSDVRVALLGPLAVAPEHQRQGLGTALVREGLAQSGARGVASVCLLGNPAYYGRLGFAQEVDTAAPYPLPAGWEAA